LLKKYEIAPLREPSTDDGQALILAHERSSLYSNLLYRVCGVVFMGTPHRGSNIALWTNILACFLHTIQLGTGTNVDLLSLLRRESSTLSDISRQFVERGESLQIRTFYETEMLDYMNCLV